MKKDLETEVTFVSNYINPVNRTFLIETKVNNIPDLKANMIATLQINDYHTDKAVLVPMNLIQSDGTESYVYVVRPKDNFNAAYKQKVEIGSSL